MTLDERINYLTERATRLLARSFSRRAMLSRFGLMLTGAAVLPLLPVRRGALAATVQQTDDPTHCDYWKYCAIDGFLCACCGGSSHSCPPGTDQSPITWIGTCHNPFDGRDYLMSYNDCCGKTSCGSCTCNRNEGEKPMYRLSLNLSLIHI